MYAIKSLIKIAVIKKLVTIANKSNMRSQGKHLLGSVSHLITNSVQLEATQRALTPTDSQHLLDLYTELLENMSKVCHTAPQRGD